MTYDGDDCTGFDLGRNTASSSSRSLTRAFNAFLSCKMSRNSGNENRGLEKNRSFGHLLQLLSGLRSGSPQAFGICEPPNQNPSVEFDICVPSRVDPRRGTHRVPQFDNGCFWFKQVHTKHFFFCYWSNICRLNLQLLTENILQLHWDDSSFQWVCIE